MTATHINYYHICHRKLWLFANGIQLEHHSELVAEGKWIHETAYDRRAKQYTEIALPGMRIDYYDPKNKVVREVKKSKAMEAAHVAQLKYYLHRLAEMGLEGVTGLLEYPKLRKTKKVILQAGDKALIEEWFKDIESIRQQPKCPNVIHAKFCHRCAYYEYCYV